MKKHLKLLLLEDDPLDAELNITALEDAGYECEWQRVQTKREFIVALEKPNYDLILIDYNLPAFDGMSALHILREKNLNIPAMLVSGNLGEELAIDSIRAGAVDYVHKDRLKRLAPSVTRTLHEQKLRRRERAQANNLALFSKLNQAANSGVDISKLIEILAIETKKYANYFGATTFLLSEDKKHLEMQYISLPESMRVKLEKLTKGKIPAVRIRLDNQKTMRDVLTNGRMQIVGTEEKVEKLIYSFVQDIVPSETLTSLKKTSYLVRKLFSLKEIAFLPLSVEKHKLGIIAFPYKTNISMHDIQQMESIADQLTEIFTRKLAEEEVEKLHRQQKLILDSADEGILGIDLEGRHTFVNPAAARMLGYEIEELVYQKIDAYYPPHGIKRTDGGDFRNCGVYDDKENAKKGQKEASFTRKDGSTFPVSYTTSPIFEQKKMTGVVLAFRDISEQVESTREIARLAEVVRQASITVAITDLDGNLVYANPYFEKSSGYSVEEVLGENLRVLKSGQQSDAFYKSLWGTITEGDTWRNVFVNKRKDGSLYHEDVSIFPIKTPEGEIINYAAVKRDISAQIEAEARIRLQLSRLDSLHAIDVKILTSPDLKAILDVVLQQVKNELGIDAAEIFVFAEALESLQCKARIGYKDNNVPDQKLRLGKGLAGKVALEQKTLRISNLKEESEGFSENPEMVSEEFLSYIGVPLIAQGKRKGVLAVLHRTPLARDMEWYKFLDMLAGQAAIAIENITLFEDLQKNIKELRLAYDSTLEGWARALELRDQETLGHSKRVTKLTMMLAKAAGIEESLLEHIYRGALLHDIGKMGVPDAILNKQGPLTDIEWMVMKQHPIFGYEMLEKIRYLKLALEIPYYHHEKWDGSGYPFGMHGDSIPLPARIFTIVDVYDALTNRRPYRAKIWEKEEALVYISEKSGTHFDPELVILFQEIMEDK